MSERMMQSQGGKTPPGPVTPGRATARGGEGPEAAWRWLGVTAESPPPPQPPPRRLPAASPPARVGEIR